MATWENFLAERADQLRQAGGALVPVAPLGTFVGKPGRWASVGVVCTEVGTEAGIRHLLEEDLGASSSPPAERRPLLTSRNNQNAENSNTRSA